MSTTGIWSNWRHKEETENDLGLSRLFRRDEGSLFVLSLLLTADPSMACRCLVFGSGCAAVGDGPDLVEWAHACARRVVAEKAIRLLKSGQRLGRRNMNEAKTRDWDDVPLCSDHEGVIGRILSLSDFERCVHVLSALEGYSDRECAMMLGVSLKRIHEAHLHTLDGMGMFNEGCNGF